VSNFIQTGAQFEILVDGKPRSYRNTNSGAMNAAIFLESRLPHSEVALTCEAER
jgi:hypothetical protein